jgi:hypothetical protein
MTASAMPVDRKNENRNASLTPGHLRMSIAISTAAAFRIRFECELPHKL